MTNPPLTSPTSNDLLNQLSDIQGLHNVSAWPLAPGWWILGLLVLTGFCVTATVILRKRAWRASWKGDAARNLDEIEAGLTADRSKDSAASLSDAVRRIAIRRFTRQSCAGLEGEEWLLWLKSHDPKGFDWVSKGRPLIEAPFAPPNTLYELGGLRELIRAAKAWVT